MNSDRGVGGVSRAVWFGYTWTAVFAVCAIVGVGVQGEVQAAAIVTNRVRFSGRDGKTKRKRPPADVRKEIWRTGRGCVRFLAEAGGVDVDEKSFISLDLIFIGRRPDLRIARYRAAIDQSSVRGLAKGVWR